MKHLLLILKEPFLDRIPSLKTLIWHLLNHSYQITLITSESDHFTLLSFEHEHLKVVKVKERSKKLELPTSVKLFFKTAAYVATHRIDYVMGGDAIGNILASKVCQLLHRKHLFFMLEYPQVITDKVQQLTKMQKLENEAMEKSYKVITHDEWHKKFLLQHLSLQENDILLLPNASFTPEVDMKSDFLQRRLQVFDKKLVLHSGGFGRWFKCKELAASTANWADDTRLVFHISHKMEGNPYFDDIYRANYNGKVLFSLSPVPTFELDALVASADVGIALYSEEHLSYRATYMGLAAGKIGNYLKCGVPVIATKLPSLTYIEDFQCGILIEKEEEIADAIQKIVANRSVYAANAHRCYKELWHPQQYLTKIVEVLG